MQQILATYGVFPKICRESANVHCSQLTKVIDFWCFKIMDHKELALSIINRFKSAKGPHDGQRCFPRCLVPPVATSRFSLTIPSAQF